MTNGPPSSGQQVRAGRRSRRTSPVTTSVDRPAGAPREADAQGLEGQVPRGPELARGRGHERLREVRRGGGRAARAACRRRARPAARCRRGSWRATASAPRTRVKSSAGPPAAIVRRWISAASSRAVDLRLDDGEVAVTAELVEEGAQVGEGGLVGHGGLSRDANIRPMSRPGAAGAAVSPPPARRGRPLPRPVRPLRHLRPPRGGPPRLPRALRAAAPRPGVGRHRGRATGRGSASRRAWAS